jgi:hypothetical protein
MCSGCSGEIDLAEKEFNEKYRVLAQKHEKLDMMLRIIDVLSKGYVQDKSLKDEVANMAADILKKELFNY